MRETQIHEKTGLLKYFKYCTKLRSIYQILQSRYINIRESAVKGLNIEEWRIQVSRKVPEFRRSLSQPIVATLRNDRRKRFPRKSLRSSRSPVHRSQPLPLRSERHGNARRTVFREELRAAGKKFRSITRSSLSNGLIRFAGTRCSLIPDRGGAPEQRARKETRGKHPRGDDERRVPARFCLPAGILGETGSSNGLSRDTLPIR